MKELVYQPNRTLSCSASCPVCPPITQEAFRKFHSLIPLLEQTARTPSPSDPASSDRFSRPANPPRDLSLSSRSQSHSRVTFIKSHPLFVHPLPPPLPPGPQMALWTSTAGLPPLMVGPSEHSSIEEHYSGHSTSEKPIRRDQARITIYMLPDEILLCIFDFCAREGDGKQGWRTLVHVCRRWRSIVFEAPHSLGVRLVCSAATPIKQALDVWPASLPISIEVVSRWVSREHEEHLLAALKHKDRVREFHVNGLANHSLERIIAAMEAPFEELTHVSLCCSDPETPPVLPESFLGGSAPNLRSFCLVGISFSSLPRMLLSATNLVYLSVGNIHPSAHLCPQLVVDCLSTLAKLQGLKIHYRSCRERTNRQLPVHPLPATRTIHPALTLFAFMGTSDFLDYLFARVDTPLLKYVDTVLFDPPILDAPRIAQFIGRTETREAFNQAHMLFYSDVVEITLSSREWTSAIGSGDGHTLQVKMSIKFQESHWRVWSLTQGLWASLPPFSEANLARHGTFEDGCVFPSISERAWAKFYFDQISLHWAKVMESAEWLQLFTLFPAVEYLYLSEGIAPYVARALQEVDGKDAPTKVLPVLQKLFVEGLQPSGPVQDAIGKFGSVRELSGCPVAVRRWEEGVKSQGPSLFR